MKTCRAGRIRTGDHTHPKGVRCQAALRPASFRVSGCFLTNFWGDDKVFDFLWENV